MLNLVRCQGEVGAPWLWRRRVHARLEHAARGARHAEDDDAEEGDAAPRPHARGAEAADDQEGQNHPPGGDATESHCLVK